MSRQTIPLVAEDLSRFTRALARQLAVAAAPPSHLTLMNMLARSAGFRNVQHLRAAGAAHRRLAEPPPVPALDHRLVERALFQFDDAGRLLRWPSRRPVQELCLWALWARLPSAATLHEREVGAILSESHAFADPALLRRSLVGLKLVVRSRDGAAYARQELPPPAEARDVIRRLQARRSRFRNRPGA